MKLKKRRHALGLLVAIVFWVALRVEVTHHSPRPTTLVGRAMLLNYDLTSAEVERQLGAPTGTYEEEYGLVEKIWEAGDQRVTIAFRNGHLSYAIGELDARRRGRSFFILAPSTRNGPRG